jgi:hypothetical protein
MRFSLYFRAAAIILSEAGNNFIVYFVIFLKLQKEFNPYLSSINPRSIKLNTVYLTSQRSKLYRLLAVLQIKSIGKDLVFRVK